MSHEKYAYYITLRKRGKEYEVLFNIGSESKTTAILKLRGVNADKIFNYAVEALARQGALVPLRISEHEAAYAVREDLGPLVGAYLILARRTRKAEKWGDFFTKLLEERYTGIAGAFSAFLELALELSRSLPGRKRGKSSTLSPIALDALSAALKQFVDRIVKAYKAGAG